MIIQNTVTSLFHFMPEIILSISSMVILLTGTLEFLKKYVFQLTILSILLASSFSYMVYPETALSLFNASIVKNDITEFFKYICYFIFLIQVLISRKYLNIRKLDSGEFYSLLIFAFTGCLIIISADNLIVLFLGIELSSLSLYSLIALDKSNSLSSEAAIKYFVLSIIASAIMLFGFSYLYGLTNSLSISEIIVFSNTNEISNLYLFSYILIFIGVAFKFAVAPFHMWLPDVYEGSPLPVTNFISSIPKIAFFVLTYKFLDGNNIMQIDNFHNIFLFLGIFSVIVGNLYALAQKKIMRLIAYSGVANSGFIFLALYAAIEYNFSVSAFYVASYSFATVSLISLVTYISSKKYNLVYIKDFKGLSASLGFISVLFMVTLLSTAGIPLTVGFYAKYLVIDSLISKDLILVAALVILMTVVGLYYYLRIIWFMFFEPGINSLVNRGDKLSVLILSFIPAIIIMVFLFPEPIFKYIFNILT